MRSEDLGAVSPVVGRGLRGAVGRRWSTRLGFARFILRRFFLPLTLLRCGISVAHRYTRHPSYTTRHTYWCRLQIHSLTC